MPELEKRMGRSVYQDLAITVEVLRKVFEDFLHQTAVI